MPTQLDPYTLQSLLQSLPDIQGRQRRAKKLRSYQERFADMAARRSEPRNHTRTINGGLYETVPTYRTDYSDYGDRIVGVLGDYFTGRSADKAEAEHEDTRNAASLGVVEQIGQQRKLPQNQRTGPTEASMRAYLGMIGGPDAKEIGVGSSTVRSTQKLANGNLGLVTDAGIEDTGIPFDYAVDNKTNTVTGETFSIGRSGAGRGQASPVQVQGGEFAPGVPFGGAQPQQQGPQPIPPEEAEDLFQRVENAESGPYGQGAVSPKGARGVMQLMPATARMMEQALGLPPGSTDTDASANRQAGRAYLGKLYEQFGDKRLALMAYNWGPGNVRKWQAAGSDVAAVPEETRNYVTKILGAETTATPLPGISGPLGAPVGGVGGAGGGGQTPGATLNLGGTQAEEEAKLRAQTALKPQLEGDVKAATLSAEARAAAKSALPQARQNLNQMVTEANRLMSMPGFEGILGGSLPGALPHEGKVGQMMKGILSLASPERSDAMASYENLAGQVYRNAFESLRGGGQITEKETERVAAAYGRLQRTQTPEAFRAALADMVSAYQAGIKKLEAAAAGAAPAAPQAPAAPAFQLPQGWGVSVE